ncbi:hypothetical protein HK100_003166 [Physocladia obscura]|uniref:Uncharacterized protein n=1 Tax=Physocladia obscura TaxID=109957 RepID=A0AAD5SUN0_9FUNG|nr:hypothetical protein HK100_003166 [Physocladia obscura]
MLQIVDSKFKYFTVLGVHALVEIPLGLLGLVGFATNLYPGAAVMFQTPNPNPSEALAIKVFYLCDYGAYHLISASFILNRLFDVTNKPAIPGPNMKLASAAMSYSPIWEMLAQYLESLPKDQLRNTMGGAGIAVHAFVGIWFIISIIAASEDWKSEDDDNEEQSDLAAAIGKVLESEKNDAEGKDSDE